jgi:branched-chain amino acid transport system substrate-binding protein
MQLARLTTAITSAALCAALFATASPAQERLKVGIVTTLSAAAGAVPGQQLRNGFELAVKTLNDRLGGVATDVVVVDDELKPDLAVTKVKALVDRDKVNFVVGPIFSNILAAIMKPVTESGAFLISPNAGTSSFAGKDCNRDFFVTSYQNDQVHEVSGQYAQDSGFKRALIIVPNYQAGKDAAAGFKHKFTGEIVNEIYVPLGQLDYAAELSEISATHPDAIYAFLPGGMGINFVKQFRQAGLADKVTFLSAFTVDESTLPAVQEAALGFFGGADWAPNLDTPQNKRFVEQYVRDYNAVPATYAFQAYDAALLIDGAVGATKGNLGDKEAMRLALTRADFTSLRGDFKFNNNHFPVQNFYLTRVAKRLDGKYQTEIVKKVFSNYGDAYAKDCPMK